MTACENKLLDSFRDIVNNREGTLDVRVVPRGKKELVVSIVKGKLLERFVLET